MSFSYKPLWKLLIDYDMSKKTRAERNFKFETIDRLCNYFECKVENVIQHCCDKEDR